MDFTYPANNNIECAVESSSSATTPPPTPQPFNKNNNNNNVSEDKDLPKVTAFVEKDDLFTSFKRTESRKRTLLLQQQQHDLLYSGSYASEHHASPLKKPVPSRFFGDLASPIGSSSYNSNGIKPSHNKHRIYKGQQHQKAMGPSIWCSSSCCTGKYQLNAFLRFFCSIPFYFFRRTRRTATAIFRDKLSV